MLIITGPEDSGMRDLALFCRRMGFETSGDAKETMQPGEEEEVIRINQEIDQKIQRLEKGESRAIALYGKLGSLLPPIFRKKDSARDKDSIRREYEEALRSLSCAVILDPRFMRCPALLEIWHTVRSDIRVLLTYRAPETSDLRGQVASSSSSLADGLRENFSDCIEMLLKRDIDFRILLFPQLLTHYDRVYMAFSDLGFVFDQVEGERVWNDLADPGTAAIGSTPLNQNETRR